MKGLVQAGGVSAEAMEAARAIVAEQERARKKRANGWINGGTVCLVAGWVLALWPELVLAVVGAQVLAGILGVAGMVSGRPVQGALLAGLAGVSLVVALG